jgi:hypothetical protein
MNDKNLIKSELFIFDQEWNKMQKNSILKDLESAEALIENKKKSIGSWLSNISPIGVNCKSNNNLNNVESDTYQDMEPEESDASTQVADFAADLSSNNSNMSND